MKLNASLLGVARAQLDICINVVKTSTILQNSERLRRSGEQQKLHRLILSTCPPLKCNCKCKCANTPDPVGSPSPSPNAFCSPESVHSSVKYSSTSTDSRSGRRMRCPIAFKLLLKLAPLPEKTCFKTNESLFHWFRLDSMSRWDW